MTDQNRNLLALSAQIVAAVAGHNDVGSAALPVMIRNVYNTLAGLDSSTAAAQTMGNRPYAKLDSADHDHPRNGMGGHDHSHARNVYVHPVYGQTVFADHLICMEDGLTMKMLKRHLLTVHGMTPDAYRAKWGLPADSPMVASDYAKLRSSLALQSGLGLKPEERSSKSGKARKG